MSCPCWKSAHERKIKIPKQRNPRDCDGRFKVVCHRYTDIAVLWIVESTVQHFIRGSPGSKREGCQNFSVWTGVQGIVRFTLSTADNWELFRKPYHINVQWRQYWFWQARCILSGFYRNQLLFIHIHSFFFFVIFSSSSSSSSTSFFFFFLPFFSVFFFLFLSLFFYFGFPLHSN